MTNNREVCVMDLLAVDAEIDCFPLIELIERHIKRGGTLRDLDIYTDKIHRKWIITIKGAKGYHDVLIEKHGQDVADKLIYGKEAT